KPDDQIDPFHVREMIIDQKQVGLGIMSHRVRCVPTRRIHHHKAIHLQQCLEQLHGRAIVVYNHNLGQSSLPSVLRADALPPENMGGAGESQDSPADTLCCAVSSASSATAVSTASSAGARAASSVSVTLSTRIKVIDSRTSSGSSSRSGSLRRG